MWLPSSESTSPSPGDALSGGSVSGPTNAVPVQYTSPSRVIVPSGVSSPAAPEAPATTTDPSLGALMRALRRRWLVGLFCGTIAAAAAVWAIMLTMPPTYTARTLIYVSAERPSVLADSGNGPDFANYQKTQLAMIKSRLVLNSALKDPAIQKLGSARKGEETVSWLEQNLQADQKLAPEIIQINLRGDDPAELAALVTAVRDAYLREVLNRDYYERADRLNRMNKLSAGYTDTAEKKQQAMLKCATSLGACDPQVLRLKHEFATAQLQSLQAELVQLQAQQRRTELEASLGATDETPPPGLVESTLDEQLKTDAVGQRIQNQIDQLEEEIARYKSVAISAEKTPGYARRLQELEGAYKAQSDRRAELQKGALERARRQLQRTREANAGSQKQRLGIIKGLIAWITTEVEARSKEVESLTRGMVEMNRLRDDLNQTEGTTRKLAERIEATQIELQAPPRARAMEDATLFYTQEPSKRLKKMVFPALGAFMVVLLGVAWLEFRSGRVNHADEVSQRLSRTSVYALPAVSSRVLRRLQRPKGSQAVQHHQALTNAVDTARLLLLPPAEVESGRLLLVSSARQTEGEDALAVHLALSCARAGARTLIVDADLRNPRLHRWFGLPEEPGFAELLLDELAPRAAIRPRPVEGLNVLTAGKGKAMALAALESQRLPTLFQWLKQEYDYVIVLAPPVLAVPDALTLGRYCDGTLLSIRRDVTQLPAVDAACERLRHLNIPMLGAVVSETTDRDVRC